MKNILQGNKIFQEFSKCCQKKSQIEKKLNGPGIEGETKNNLKKRLRCIEEEISKLELRIQDNVKVS